MPNFHPKSEVKNQHHRFASSFDVPAILCQVSFHELTESSRLTTMNQLPSFFTGLICILTLSSRLSSAMRLPLHCGRGRMEIQSPKDECELLERFVKYLQTTMGCEVLYVLNEHSTPQDEIASVSEACFVQTSNDSSLNMTTYVDQIEPCLKTCRENQSGEEEGNCSANCHLDAHPTFKKMQESEKKEHSAEDTLTTNAQLQSDLGSPKKLFDRADEGEKDEDKEKEDGSMSLAGSKTLVLIVCVLVYWL